MVRTGILALAFIVCSGFVAQRPAYLRFADGGFASTNGLSVSVSASGMQRTSIQNRREVFHGHPYDISLAALIGNGEAVMIHAERVADGSGASNYDDLPAASWPSGAFRLRRPSCNRVAAADIQGEHDLEWLRANNFSAVGSLLLQQTILTSDDHNNEVVISLLIKGVNCEDDAARNAAITRLEARVRVVRS